MMYRLVISASQTQSGNLRWQADKALHPDRADAPDIRVTFANPIIDGFAMASLLKQLAAELEEAARYAVATNREPDFG